MNWQRRVLECLQRIDLTFDDIGVGPKKDLRIFHGPAFEKELLGFRISIQHLDAVHEIKVNASTRVPRSLLLSVRRFPLVNFPDVLVEEVAKRRLWFVRFVVRFCELNPHTLSCLAVLIASRRVPSEPREPLHSVVALHVFLRSFEKAVETLEAPDDPPHEDIGTVYAEIEILIMQ